MGKAGWFRIIPFAVFMAFIGVQQILEWSVVKGWLDLTAQQMLYLYPLKTVLVLALILFFWRQYNELHLVDFKNLTHTIASVLLGLLVFVLWINMDWGFTALGESKGFDPFLVENAASRNLLIFFRLFGAALVVPIMEELFWRSFMLRYVITADFSSVRIGTFTLTSFLICAVLFGLEHNLILAGMMAGAAYSGLLYWTKSIYQCVLAHAVTNLVLGIYVLQTGFWHFW
ncbi:CAAX prenyl protease-related protein [uncultured Desulfuromusa sp.]|uniref:CAAX prenyl protease-related protein n=1 Tax=uncultured Desulfuromusa sp. TaxID=219183 RepID=UPI002AA7F28B|nr:CAAX prenyl protease-related protein [uncultured Desulfuromusa sp.]